MHPNPAFRQTPQPEMLAFARDRGFGTLILGTDPWPMSPKGLQDRIVSEIAVWAPIVKASGAKVDG